jgi:hypothetical protein
MPRDRAAQRTIDRGLGAGGTDVVQMRNDEQGRLRVGDVAVGDAYYERQR